MIVPGISVFTRKSQPDLHYIGVSVPVGRLPVEQMRAVADIAERFGNGEIRPTVWQNLVIPHLATEQPSTQQKLLSSQLA